MDPFKSRRESRAFGDSGAYGSMRPGATTRRPGDSGVARTSTPGAKRERSPVEKAVVWGGISILTVIVLIESGARLSYNRAYGHLDERFNQASRANPFLLSEATTLVRRDPVQGSVKRPSGAYDTYTWKWFSLFKPSDYQLRIYVIEQDGNKIVAEWKSYEQFRHEDEAIKAAAEQAQQQKDEPPPTLPEPDPKATPNLLPDFKKAQEERKGKLTDPYPKEAKEKTP